MYLIRAVMDVFVLQWLLGSQWPQRLTCAWPLTYVWPPQHSGVNSSDTQVLTLYNVTEEESGEYICKVANYIGQANQSAWLTVVKHLQGNTRPLLQRFISAERGRHTQLETAVIGLLDAHNSSSHFVAPFCFLWCPLWCRKWRHGKSQQSNWKHFGFCLHWTFPSLHLCATLCPPNKGVFHALWRLLALSCTSKAFQWHLGNVPV